MNTAVANADPARVRPRLRLVHKLFGLLALSTLLALVALGGSTLINLRSGFVGYVNTLDLARLAPLARRLEARDDATTGFTGLRDRARWDALLRDELEPSPPPRPARALADRAPVQAVARPGMPAPPAVMLPEPPAPPAPPALAAPAVASGPLAAPALPLPPRIALLDAQQRLVAGAAPGPEALQRPLERDGVVVGWLSLRPLTQLADSRDTDFLAGQARTMAWVGVVLLLVSLIVAWLFARHLLHPLHAVERAASRLSDGDYAVQLDTTRRDELGDLVRHVNRLGAALQANETSRRRWIADISHELRTPLAIVRGEVEAMQDGLRAADADGLRSLHEEVLRLGRLVDDLHQLSMADLGALAHRPRPVDLSVLLRAACAHFEGAAREAGITVALRLDDVIVHADVDRLRQLVDNLLDNALRYTDRDGRVEIELVRDGDDALLRIDDTPPGVEAEALSHLFEPLYRAEASRDRRRGGSGLGLAIAERIATAHGGRLRASPSPLGGLRLELHLPQERTT